MLIYIHYSDYAVFISITQCTKLYKKTDGASKGELGDGALSMFSVAWNYTIGQEVFVFPFAELLSAGRNQVFSQNVNLAFCHMATRALITKLSFNGIVYLLG